MAIRVRRICAGEGQELKEIRLRALADAPDAFASTYATEAGMPDDWWNALVCRRSSHIDDATFVAEIDGQIVGLVGVFRDGGRSEAHLVSMWTAPEARRLGIARAMMATAVAWAHDSGVSELDLWVTVGNEPAHRLYESAGFELTGDAQPLPSDPSKAEVRMRRRLQ